MNLAHILLVLWRLSHTRHPHLAQPGRVLRLDVLSQLLGHLLRQLVDLFKVVGQPVRLWVQVKEDTRAARPEAITVLRGAGGGKVVRVDDAELAVAGQIGKVAGHAVRGVVGKELWKEEGEGDN